MEAPSTSAPSPLDSLAPMPTRPLLAALVLAVSGCSAFGSDGGFTIEARPPTLLLENGSGQTLYVLAVEAEAAALIDLNPNVDEWPRIEAGETLEVPYESLDGFDEGDSAAVVFFSYGRGYEHVRVPLFPMHDSPPFRKTF